MIAEDMPNSWLFWIASQTLAFCVELKSCQLYKSRAEKGKFKS